jgi:hypothetical protein
MSGTVAIDILTTAIEIIAEVLVVEDIGQIKEVIIILKRTTQLRVKSS